MSGEVLKVRRDRFSGDLLPDVQSDESRESWESGLGTRSQDVADYIVTVLGNVTERPREGVVNTLLAFVADGKPRDPQELFLLTQMACVSQIMLHNICQLDVHRIVEVDKEGVSRIVARFGRLYARQMEALHKYRRNGEQTVTVVHAGQAIVGNVTTGGSK